MKKVLSIILSALLLFALLPAGAFAEGPVEIGSYSELKAFADRVNGGETALSAKLTQDIVCENDDGTQAYDWPTIGNESNPYSGTFDGCGHTIDGLSNYFAQQNSAGLFGCVGTSGAVKNVAVTKGDIDGYGAIGGIVGINHGTVQSCCYSGYVVGGYRLYNGGIVGKNYGTVECCLFVGQSQGGVEGYTGGIVGNNYGTVECCLFVGQSQGGVDGYTGGIVALNENGVVKNCLNAGYTQGGVRSITGGIAGFNDKGTVQYCLNVGKLLESTDATSGFVVGINSSEAGTVLDSCYYLRTSCYGIFPSCGAVGIGPSPDSVKMVSSTDLASLSNLTGLSTNWWTDGHGFPLLKCFDYLFYEANGGSGTVNFTVGLDGAVMKTAEYYYTNGDKIFYGWNTKADGSGTNYAEKAELNLADGEVFLVLYANWKNPIVNIEFVNDDGTVLQSSQIAFGETPVYTGETPTKPATVQHTYTFAGWTPEIEPAVDDVTYTATYTSTVNKYTVKFVNEDGTVLQSGLVEYGETPAYTGETPTKPSTAQYTYTFAGWTPEIEPAVDDVTYTATYTSTVNKYTVKFVNEDGTVLQSGLVEYGETPAYTGETPTKPSTAQYTYTFAGWTPDITAVTGDATYTATYTSTVNKYTIKFVNEDGTVLQSGLVEYGETPAYTGETPTKPSTAQYTYSFAGWTPEIAAVTGDATYTAVYTSTVNTYTVTFVDGLTNEVIAEVTVEYGAGAEAPEAPVHVCYLFEGWEGEYACVTGDVTVTAIYTLLGDIDGDGETSAADAVLIMRYSIEILDEIDVQMADVNGDGKVDLVDALIVLRHAMGII